MNAEMQLFNPLDLELSRSTFEGSPTVSGTCNAGRLIPLQCIDVMPGSEYTFQGDMLIKMSTPVYPTMDDLFCDVFAFFVPWSLILSRRYASPALDDSISSWKAFVGAQDFMLNMPIPASGVELPKLYVHDQITPGSLLDYFDLDVNTYNARYSVHPLELMAYFAIYNENFRDPNVMEPVTWSFDSSGNLVPYGHVDLYTPPSEVNPARGTSITDYGWVNALGNNSNVNASASYEAQNWLPFPVCRFHGYFGSLLPWPQRNTDGVELPLGDKAPVVTGPDQIDVSDLPLTGYTGKGLHALSLSSGIVNLPFSNTYVTAGPTLGNDAVSFANGSNSSNISGYLLPNNLWADLSSATAANVNALRAAIQKQRWYEKLARSGNRYDELMYGTFGVRPHNSGDDRPRYLGGTRIHLRMDMVASTNGGASASTGQGAGSLGALGAFSHTNDSSLKVHAGFDDWGCIMFLGCIRHHDMFSTGTKRQLLTRTRDDIYFPTFAHLGEQSTTDFELVDADNATGAVLGYNEAWQENRVWLDRVHGLLRPGQSLAYMTYARDFSNSLDLASFLNASTQIADVDKTLAVSSKTSGFQFVYQFTNNIRARLPLPTHSIPGLMDHF